MTHHKQVLFDWNVSGQALTTAGKHEIRDPTNFGIEIKE